MKKTKVLLFTDVWVAGGISKYIVDITEKINKDLFDFEVLVSQIKTTAFLDGLAKNNIKIQCLIPQDGVDPIRRVVLGARCFKKMLKRISPDIVHFHASNATMLIYAFLAKKAGVNSVIVHSHNTNFGNGNRIIKHLGHGACRLFLGGVPDKKLACSKEAGDWIFPMGSRKSIEYIKCFVDTGKFQFNENDREDIRAEYGIVKDLTVFLSIGRFDYQKNQLFLIDVFQRISKEQNAVLFLIGEGELEKDILKRIEDNCLGRKVFLIKTNSNIHKYMSAADVFLLPSLYEGNPITAIEAQASGLVCFLSRTITKEARVTDNLFFVDINDATKCSKEVLTQLSRKSMRQRSEYSEIVKNAGYFEEKQVMELEKIYSCFPR